MKSESCRSGSLLPRSGNFARRPPKGCSPCGIDGDVSRDTPALAFGVTVPFSRSRCSTRHGHPTGRSRADRPQAPSRHSPLLPTSSALWAGPAEASVSIHPVTITRGGLEILRAGGPVCKPERPVSGPPRYCRPPWDRAVKKPGRSRKHLAKVGTPAGTPHACTQAERDVVGELRGPRQGLAVLDRRGGDRADRRSAACVSLALL